MNRMNNNDCCLFVRPEIHNQVALSFGHVDFTYIFGSCIADRLICHCPAFVFNQIIDCFPTYILDQWFARGIKTAISDDPSCSVLKLLKFRDFINATVRSVNLSSIIFLKFKVAERHDLETFRDYPRPSRMNSFCLVSDLYIIVIFELVGSR